jgi:hypothetical protein
MVGLLLQLWLLLAGVYGWPRSAQSVSSYFIRIHGGSLYTAEASETGAGMTSNISPTTNVPNLHKMY